MVFVVSWLTFFSIANFKRKVPSQSSFYESSRESSSLASVEPSQTRRQLASDNTRSRSTSSETSPPSFENSPTRLLDWPEELQEEWIETDNNHTNHHDEASNPVELSSHNSYPEYPSNSSISSVLNTTKYESQKGNTPEWKRQLQQPSSDAPLHNLFKPLMSIPEITEADSHNTPDSGQETSANMSSMQSSELESTSSNRSNQSGSPLKLFQKYDTYTNSKFENLLGSLGNRESKEQLTTSPQASQKANSGKRITKDDYMKQADSIMEKLKRGRSEPVYDHTTDSQISSEINDSAPDQNPDSSLAELENTIQSHNPRLTDRPTSPPRMYYNSVRGKYEEGSTSMESHAPKSPSKHPAMAVIRPEDLQALNLRDNYSDVYYDEANHRWLPKLNTSNDFGTGSTKVNEGDVDPFEGIEDLKDTVQQEALDRDIRRDTTRAGNNDTMSPPSRLSAESVSKLPIHKRSNRMLRSMVTKDRQPTDEAANNSDFSINTQAQVEENSSTSSTASETTTSKIAYPASDGSGRKVSDYPMGQSSPSSNGSIETVNGETVEKVNLVDETNQMQEDKINQIAKTAALQVVEKNQMDQLLPKHQINEVVKPIHDILPQIAPSHVLHSLSIPARTPRRIVSDSLLNSPHITLTSAHRELSIKLSSEAASRLLTTPAELHAEWSPVDANFSHAGHATNISAVNGSFSGTYNNLVKTLELGSTGNWVQLTNLDISNRSLSSLLQLDKVCPQLEVLNASGNALQVISGVPTSLLELDVSNNKLTELTSFMMLHDLRRLNLTNNRLASLVGVSGLVHLCELNVDSNHLRSITGLYDMRSLRRLSARCNYLEELNFDRCHGSELEELLLSHNRIEKIKGLDRLRCLILLDLDRNKVLSFGGGKCPSIRGLYLTGNGASLDVSSFKSLKELRYDGNRRLLGAGSLKKLETLTMRNSKSIDYPWVAQCDVRRLCLSGNHMQRFPIREPFLNLHELELSGVGLTSLPESFSEFCLNLRELDLSFNRLEDVSPLLGIPKLRRLYLYSNLIGAIDGVIDCAANMQYLTVLDLRANPVNDQFYPPLGVKDRESYRLSHRETELAKWLEKDDEYVLRSLSVGARKKRSVYQGLILGASRGRLRWFDGKKWDAESAMDAYELIRV
jgi:Leucine-rich repeat (LRR) protein